MTRAEAGSRYDRKKTELIESWHEGQGQVRLAKSTISNLFRYQPRGQAERRISLGQFNEIIALDADAGTLEVEGLTTFETIVSHCLAHGFLPPVSPELKHITIGGATVGIGIESTCYRNGFVHDALLEADVLLPDGKIVTCRPDNELSDLFYALPNSYGTLGYILRAKIRIEPARPFVELEIRRFDDIQTYLDAMQAATELDDVDFVEGLYFEDERYYLKLGRLRDRVARTEDILRRNIYYQLVQSRETINLTTKDYIFRYDPEWFWNIPETPFYALFRRFAPERFRNSSFYTRHVAREARIRAKLGLAARDTEPLIQDWEVPWDRAAELIRTSLSEVDLAGRPWAAVPIRTPRQPTLYPIQADTLYFNLGCYCQVSKPAGKPDYHYTRVMDDKCFELGGIKMLYSSTFLGKDEFDQRFNGAAYAALKNKYDPGGNAPTLYQKVAMPLG
jgi:FAD/FMN-containing dehydrogenase